MAESARTKVSKQELDHAQATWGAFVELMKWSAAFTAAVLILMAVFLV